MLSNISYFQGSAKNEAERKFYVSMGTMESPPDKRGQGFIFTIDVDSGELLHSLKLIGRQDGGVGTDCLE